MNPPRNRAVDGWRFDGKTIIVTIPMAWKRRGGRRVIIVPDGGDAWAPTKPRPDETLIRALARAHRWKRLLKGGEDQPCLRLPVAQPHASFARLLQRCSMADSRRA